ncbi:MAG: SO_0444 family Cu/Zn efflux transporter [Chlorobiaceae bacterium]
MTEILSITHSVLYEAWLVLLESAPLILIGFFVAALLKAFLPENFIATHLGKNGIKNILKAAAFGIPIPLCSCGVLPTAAGLKKQGAGKGAVAAFLISTPETGVDSIAVSFALLDPLMTVLRPVVAFITAVAAGIAVSLSESRNIDGIPEEYESVSVQVSSCDSSCCSSKKYHAKQTIAEKFMNGMSFAFGDLLKDIGPWFFAGILLSGLISVFISPEMISRYFSNEYLSMALMLAMSVPLNVCSTASTPIAAALAFKGFSPGAALVFLLAGPATNAASLTVIFKMLGKKASLIYLSVIAGTTFLSGIAVNALYTSLGLNITKWIANPSRNEGNMFEIVSAVVLVTLVVKAYIPVKTTV